MPGKDVGGVTGESAKETWLPAVLQVEHAKREAQMNTGIPKRLQIDMPFRPPWTSIGMAPTEENLRDASYGGSA